LHQVSKILKIYLIPQEKASRSKLRTSKVSDTRALANAETSDRSLNTYFYVLVDSPNRVNVAGRAKPRSCCICHDTAPPLLSLVLLYYPRVAEVLSRGVSLVGMLASRVGGQDSNNQLGSHFLYPSCKLLRRTAIRIWYQEWSD